jgi:hypothetical protein
LAPLGTLIVLHQVLDQVLVPLIWLLQRRKKAERCRIWDTTRPDPPSEPAGNRVTAFENAAKVFSDPEAQKITQGIVEDLRSAVDFRNMLVHGRSAGITEGELQVFWSKPKRPVRPRTASAPPDPPKMCVITLELLIEHLRALDKLIDRVGQLGPWIEARNGELTRQLEREWREAIVRLLHHRAATRLSEP